MSFENCVQRSIPGLSGVHPNIVAFSGHRPSKLGGYVLPNPIFNRIVEELHTYLLSIKPKKAISGMALGVDQWAAEICLDLGIPLIAAIPFEGQENRWPEESQKRYRSILKHANEIVHICEPGYAAWKMQTRNQWMVNHCDALLAVFDGTPGGTSNCVKYAQSIDRKCLIINPGVTYGKGHQRYFQKET